MEPFLEPLEYALPTPLLDQSSIVPEISLFCQKKKKIKEDATKTIIIARKSILLSLRPCLFLGIHFPGNHFPNFPVFVCH
jgi:hypothetical protein